MIFILCSAKLNAKTEIDKAFRQRTESNTGKFVLYSPDMYNGQKVRDDQVYNSFGCNGANISPKLVWKNAPQETKSFAITIFNKDTKTNSGWWHWIVYNIPVDMTSVESGASDNKKAFPKEVVQVLNDYGTKNYGGVCPQDNNRENLTISIHALSIEKLNLPKNVMPAMSSLFINKYTIATAKINVFYKKELETISMNNYLESENVNFELNSKKSATTKTKNNSGKNKQYHLNSGKRGEINPQKNNIIKD